MERIWRIELLGGLRVLCGDNVVTRFRVDWSASLLACLAYHRSRSFQREALIELLWPEMDPQTGNSRLRQALHHLHQRLEPLAPCRGRLIVTEGRNVLLNPAACSTDAAEFQSALQAADRAGHGGQKGHWLKRAVELYRGELLPGFYEEWAQQPRLHLAHRYHHALDLWIDLLREQGDLPAAVDWARRLVSGDPLCEEGHEQLIRLLAAADQPEAALHQYQELEQLSEREFGVAPSPEIAALARALQRRFDEDSGPSLGTAAGGSDPAGPCPAAAIARAALQAGRVELRLGHYQRAAALLQESLRQSRSAEDSGGAALALEALGSLAHRRHEAVRARSLYEQSLSLYRTRGDMSAAVRLLRQLADVSRQEGDLERARALTAEVLEVQARLGDRAGVAASLGRMGRLAAAQDDPERERTCYEESLAIYRQLEDTAGVAAMYLNLGRLALRRRQYERAESCCQESQRGFREIDDRKGIAQSLAVRMEAALHTGDHAGALTLGEESLAVYRALDDSLGTAALLLQLGALTLAMGDADLSRACYQEAMTLYRQRDSWRGIARALTGLGNAAYAQGDYVATGRFLRESLALYRELVGPTALAPGVCRLARVIGRQGDSERAVRLFAAVARDDCPFAQSPFASDDSEDGLQVRSLQEALGDARFTAAWAAGRAMSLEEAVAAASHP